MSNYLNGAFHNTTVFSIDFDDLTIDDLLYIAERLDLPDTSIQIGIVVRGGSVEHVLSDYEHVSVQVYDRDLPEQMDPEAICIDSVVIDDDSEPCVSYIEAIIFDPNFFKKNKI